MLSSTEFETEALAQANLAAFVRRALAQPRVSRPASVSRAIKAEYRRIGADEPKVVWVTDPSRLVEAVAEWARSLPADLRLTMAAWRRRWGPDYRYRSEHRNGRWVTVRDPHQLLLSQEHMPQNMRTRELVLQPWRSPLNDRMQMIALQGLDAKLAAAAKAAGAEPTKRDRYNLGRRIQNANPSLFYQANAVGYWTLSGARVLVSQRMMEVAIQHTDGMILLPGVAFVSKLPVRGPTYDAQKRLHHPDLPVLEWEGGWSIWAWQDRFVPAKAIEAPETLTATDIRREDNAEVRRIMIERMGYERFLKLAGATKVSEDTDAIGLPRRLWDLQPNLGLGGRIVEVTNSTPEPDGTRKSYFLRVPRTVNTPLEAVAWTFRMNADQYANLAAES